MKKLLTLPFKIVAGLLLVAGLLVLTIGGLIVNGPKKTGENLAKMSEALNGLKNI